MVELRSVSAWTLEWQGGSYYQLVTRATAVRLSFRSKPWKLWGLSDGRQLQCLSCPLVETNESTGHPPSCL